MVCRFDICHSCLLWVKSPSIKSLSEDNEREADDGEAWVETETKREGCWKKNVMLGQTGNQTPNKALITSNGLKRPRSPDNFVPVQKTRLNDSSAAPVKFVSSTGKFLNSNESANWLIELDGLDFHTILHKRHGVPAIPETSYRTLTGLIRIYKAKYLDERQIVSRVGEEILFKYLGGKHLW